MATMTSLIYRVRQELGDFQETFRTSLRANGTNAVFDLPANNVSSLQVTQILHGVVTNLAATAYTLDAQEGVLSFSTPPVDTTVFMVTGQQVGLFTDLDLTSFVNDALLQHLHGSEVTIRYKTPEGFLRYRTVPMSLDTLPPVEELLVAVLATVEALWALSTDAATDIDITTPEGTSVPRSQRFQQLRYQIDVMTAKYIDMCQQLNVGLHRIEMSTLRRVAVRTGRLVPVFAEREYDDHALPVRELPGIDRKDVDESGIPSPLFSGWGGF